MPFTAFQCLLGRAEWIMAGVRRDDEDRRAGDLRVLQSVQQL